MRVRKQVQRRRVRSNTGVRSRVSFGFLSTEVDTRGERLGSLIGLSYDLTDMLVSRLPPKCIVVCAARANVRVTGGAVERVTDGAMKGVTGWWNWWCCPSYQLIC